MVTENQYEHIDSLGIKIDRIVGSPANLPTLQEDVLNIPADTHPLQDALNYLCLEQYPAVNILTKDFQADTLHSYTDKINWVVYLSRHRIFPVKSGFSKWKAQGEIIEILSEDRGLVVEGLQQIGDKRYEVKNDGIYTLRFNQPFIFVAEEY